MRGVPTGIVALGRRTQPLLEPWPGREKAGAGSVLTFLSSADPTIGGAPREE